MYVIYSKHKDNASVILLSQIETHLHRNEP